MNSSILNFEKKLNIRFKNKKLLENALTHKSLNKEVNNEKLEFIGDRVIGLVLSKKLFDLYPEENEGSLDKRFAKLVNRETCSSVAWSIGLQNFILLGNSKKKINQDDKKILSDACEALIGAIYIDRGFYFIKDYILKIWKKELKYSNITVLDSKTKLQEYSLKLYKNLPTYELFGRKGPKHNPIFKISVSINKSKKFYGEGNSKQQAEQDAAAKLIKNLNL